MNARAFILVALAFVFALSSIVYELNLAHLLVATLGGTVLRYATVIGLFTFGLGMGALAFSALAHRYRLPVLILTVEALLVVVGVVAPHFVRALDPGSSPPSRLWLCEVLSYLPTLAIGFLSGFELPALMAWTQEPANGLRVLAADYLGMFIGALIFPLWLLPRFGVFQVSYAMASLNAVLIVAIAALWRFGGEVSVESAA